MFSVRNLDFLETPKVYLWMVYLTLPRIISLRHLRFLEEFRRGWFELSLLLLSSWRGRRFTGLWRLSKPGLCVLFLGLGSRPCSCITLYPYVQMLTRVFLRSGCQFARSGCAPLFVVTNYKKMVETKKSSTKWLVKRQSYQNLKLSAKWSQECHCHDQGILDSHSMANVLGQKWPK